jgi:predicted transcriptional regulator
MIKIYKVNIKMDPQYRISHRSAHKSPVEIKFHLALQEQERIKNRSKLDIIYDILISATGGVKKTHIMSHANLSSEQMNYYFNTLLSHSLLNAEKDSDNNLIYKTTHKGIRFLHCCAQIKSLIAPVAKVRMRSDLLFL